MPTIENGTEPLAEKKCLNSGLVALMSVDGNDITPAQAARTSYRSFVEDHSPEDNENLVDYLIRHEHGSPIEFPDVTFYMVLPIFVARQLIRNTRVGVSVNEESLRYVSARPEYYVPSPEECRRQSKSSKQGSSDEVLPELANKTAISIIQASCSLAHESYQTLHNVGLSNEMCRVVLPLAQYTAWTWKINLRSLFHLLKLRLDPHAQYQTSVYAQAMLDLIKPYFPATVAAWENHVLNAVTFSGDEWDAIYFTLHRYLRDGDSDWLTTAVLQVAKENGMRPTRLKEFEQKLKKQRRA